MFDPILIAFGVESKDEKGLRNQYKIHMIP